MMFIHIFAACMFVLWYGGCSSSSTPSSTSTMSATIQGANWQARTIQATQSNGVIAIAGIDASGTIQIQLRAVGLTSPGTARISVGSPHSALLSENAVVYLAGALGGSGSITFTKLTSTEAAGSFEFVAPSQDGKVNRTVSNGSFSVRFQ